ncbi:ATPase [Bifidobacterium sp. SMB2]|uniref:Sensor-like histidine kinase SenX3 n=2 Tax=Bifidobacterium TaxID=1678 RepID=A0ABX0CFQ3_9BIFI|nr:ATP-binding protein [Bifidobacterium sp. SMB2]NEG95178.1 ATPase [Bifidobacterium sp. SMB2]NEH11255.1 ATPase [Bifidobacterium saimiriisciurei]
MILIAFIAIIAKIYNWAYPFISRYINADTIAHWRARIGFRPSGRDDDDDDDDDDLDYEIIRLLAVLPSTSIVVNDDDEVLIAGPAAYRLGIVDDESIVNDRVLSAIHNVRESGGKRSCELVTETARRFADPFVINADEDSEARGEGNAVSRPNWLKVTVGQIADDKTVVLIDDVSEERRFAQVREDFVANVTEQLLKPTKALETLGEDLEQDDVDIDRIMVEASQVREYAAHMGHLVADLLLLIKAQQKVVPGKDNEVGLLAEVRQAADGMRAAAEAKNVRLVVNGDDSLMVHAESEQLQGAVVKLIENAVEYSPNKSAVGVAVSKSKDGKHAVIRVVDQGCGIAREDQPRIFERFYRGGNQSSATKDGVGLGLAIVKHVALTHHGSVSVWSAPRKGSTFTFTLPLAQ